MSEISPEISGPPLPPRYRLRDLILGDHFLGSDSDSDRVNVEFFTNERSFKSRLQLYFIKNQRSSLRIRFFNFAIKVISCLLYVIRVIQDTPQISTTVCYCNFCKNHTWHNVAHDKTEFTKSISIHWGLIIFVNRDFYLWIVQVIVAIISLLQSCIVTYLSYKGNILHNLLAPAFLLELLNTVPFIVTIFSPRLRCLFIPVFFNCLLAKKQMEQMLCDLNRLLQRSSSALAQRLVSVITTVFCLLFISVCGIQHLQRGGQQHLTLFESMWLVVVTFSTVGYGDYRPDIWPSQLFMIIMICLAIYTMPGQLEKLGVTWLERHRMGGSYSRHRARTEKHVVVCTTTLHADTIMDFLNEFYAHTKLQDFYVVLLSPCDLDRTLKMILQIPIWEQRVIFIQGSALKDSDLARCRMQYAEASFIICARSNENRNAADQHTIMRAWAVKDFAPHVPQYVQIYRPENKVHVQFCEYVVCEDEFKYAIMANNCHCPGISTVITLLLHTSRGLEGKDSDEEWHQLYGRCSGNEVYHIRLGDSRFFGEFVDKSFTYASFNAHRKFGVALLAVQPMGQHILLNPGPRHKMSTSDTCFYLSITKEENSTFRDSTGAEIINTREAEEAPGLERGQGSFKIGRVASQRLKEGKVRKRAEKSTGAETVDLMSRKQENETEQPSVVVSSPDCIRVADSKSEESVKSNATCIPEVQLQPPSPIVSSVKRQIISPKSGGLLSLPFSGDADNGDSPDTTAIASKEKLLRRRKSSIAQVLDFSLLACNDLNSDNEHSDKSDYVIGFPSVPPYIGATLALCHLMKHKRSLCCLPLIHNCSHGKYMAANEYGWNNRIILVCADYASNGLYNFIVPLRASWRHWESLKPIVLLIESEPDNYFLEAISYFPMVYWMIASIDCIDDLLRAGINFADNLVIVNKESSNSVEEETLSDCNTIVAVQTIFRLFPSANIMTELRQSSNMRFVQFKAEDSYALSMSRLEKKEREIGSQLSFMFRLPFAAGNVFSASMMDTLLYQAFVKDYLITFVRLLLGIDQSVGSGHLSCLYIQQEDLWIRTYGRLYQKLCSTCCDIPIGIYRTVQQNAAASVISFDGQCGPNSAQCNRSVEQRDIAQMVRCRMLALDLNVHDYKEAIDNGSNSNISYVIINPSFETKLKKGDCVYIIKPSSLSTESILSRA